MNDTTRRFPRSMHGVDAAFRDDPEYAIAFHMDRCARTSLIAEWLAWAVVIGAPLVAVFW